MTYRIEKPTLLDETGTFHANMLATRLQELAGGPSGYRLRRIILTNFWLYTHQVIEVPHGRLFLAGDNGSGKSTVLTAAITLALDGDHRPERIDTFGKREKKIDYYILGGESNTPFYRDHRSSYLALEFEWCETQEPPFASELRDLWEKGKVEEARFLTIGLAFAGNKNNVSPITAIRFLITDGTRLGSDELSTLVNPPGEEPHVCDFKTFKKAVSLHGIVCERQADYEQKVAQYLFNFQKTEDLARLTRQLLYLRQPNLNSVLSLEKVRSYLDESLPELPFTLIEHAAEMLDKMEDLKETTAKLKSAYDAAEKLDWAQKFATMAQARLSACESLYTLDLLEKKRKEVQRLERNIRKSERDLQSSKERVEILEKERSELEGKVSALENSEGLQLAQRLSKTQDQLRLAKEDLDRSQQTLISATSRREQTEEESENQSKTFRQSQRDTIQLLQTMQSSAEREARWTIASEQLLTTLERVKSLALDASLLDIPETLSSLEEHIIAQYLSWLETLKRLHAELEQANNNLRSARQQEQKAFNALDELTRQFESKRTEVCTAQQDLADQLELLLEPTVWASLAPSSEQAALTWNASLLPSDSVPALEKIQQAYGEAIENIQKKIEREENALEELLTSEHKEQGVKEQEIKRLQEAYQQKLQDPEFVPWRALHRESAREYLAKEGIQALPFYMLIDFTEEIDSQAPLAGGIEQALTDAGLLDALVVLPEQVEAMDACCLAQGLNDCRFDLHRLTDEPSFNLASLAIMHLLRVDPALSECVGEKVTIWAETVQFLLACMQSASATAEEDLHRWTHGLLTGTVGTGEARCIGKATRVRAQQEELARLREQEERLSQELATLTANIAQNNQEKQQLITLRKDLAALLPQSNLSELSATLRATLDNLHRADRDYNQAKVAAQTWAEKLREFRIRLEKEAGRTARFAADPEEVEKAREAVTSLRSEYKTLIVYLQNVRNTWKGYQRAQQKLAQDSIAEHNATLAKQRDETDITRIKAELKTLEQLAREAGDSNLMMLQAQLATWQSRQHSLPQELIEANKAQGHAQGLLDNHRENYTAALEAQTQAEKQHENRLQTFQALLSAYPVEILIEVRQQSEDSKISPESLQKVLGEKFEADDNAYNNLKADLEKRAQTRHSELSQAFVNVSSTLHAYGPYFDEAEIVRFTNAKDANAHELLTDLAEEIRFQELLLDTKERELFQDFLLKEMANTVGVRLTEAEAWIDRMNAILADSPFMDARYRLKWVARQHDPQRPGSHLALYRDVLRRQAETFNQEEIAKLVDAFKQEIVTHQQAGSTANFTETLISILDYRRWFQFEIDMIHPNGNIQRLTNKFFRSGSGAEQYIELYVPFFTTLSALYERAGKGAPRLIALDEAFDKVSTTNTRKLINFLARQNFQWIMTGPRVTGEGTELPACVKYTMFCRKNEELAAGFPAFWSSNSTIANEMQADQ